MQDSAQARARFEEKLLDLSAEIDRFEEQEHLRLGELKKLVAKTLQGSSFAELEEFFADVKRRQVLDGADADIRGIVRTRVEQWSARRAVRP